MALKDVSSLLDKEFVTVELDWDRAPGARDIERRYIDKDQGLPWFAFIDGDGKALITSTAPVSGNVGFPAQPNEIAHYKTMLEKVKKHLTDADIAYLIKSLEEANKK